MQTFVELIIKQVLDPKIVIFWGLGPKNLFRAVLAQENYEAKFQNPSSNFHTFDLILFRAIS